MKYRIVAYSETGEWVRVLCGYFDTEELATALLQYFRKQYSFQAFGLDCQA